MRNSLRKIIKNCLPHGIVTNRNRNRFLNEYDAWKLNGGKPVVFDSECRFSQFVSVDGYGCSGSSVVMDLLREYDGCTVWATKPAFTKNSVDGNMEYGEFDLCRHTGGLLYIEYMMRPEAWVNDFWSDDAVKNFIHTAYYSDIYQGHKELRPLFFTFFERIVGQRMRSDAPLLNVWHNRFSGLNDIFTLRMMPKDEYQLLCREFLYTLFNRLFPKGSGMLVLDHVFGDCGDDMSRFEPYLPGIKRLVVSRDVRAVYVHACKNNLRWLAHDTVEDFVEWESKMHFKSILDGDSRSLELQFEDIVLEYDAEVAKVEKFLNLMPQQHVLKKRFFKPEISSSNVHAWRNAVEYAADCEKIKSMIPQYCYKP